MNDTILTREGYEKLVAELNDLRENKRHEVSERLRAALEGGGDDLLENAELEAAKNEQSFVEGRISELEYLVATAKVVDEISKTSGIQVGSTITVQEVGETEKEVYRIVGAAEADPNENKISNESPIGKAVFGHKKGETVEVSAPGGSYRLKIIKVE